MKQRVAIARAFASELDILLMDEPFGALDAQTRYQMEEEILRLWEEERRTVVFVTNNIEEAVYLGDRIVLLEGEAGHGLDVQLQGNLKSHMILRLYYRRNACETKFHNSDAFRRTGR